MSQRFSDEIHYTDPDMDPFRRQSMLNFSKIQVLNPEYLYVIIFFTRVAGVVQWQNVSFPS